MDDAGRFSTRIRYRCTLALLGCRRLERGNGTFKVVCPAGVRDGEPTLPDWDAIYTRADALLYEAKARGRNQVVSAVWRAEATHPSLPAGDP